jgi:hypothetical protein
LTPRKRNGIAAAFRGNCTAFVPRQLTAADAGRPALPRQLAGFPVHLTYRDVRPSLTGAERVFVAEYRPQAESFVEAGACRKLSYAWACGGPYHVDVLHDRDSGVWSVYKFRGGVLASHISARGFGEAMIRATGLGLERDEPAFTYVGDPNECQRENRAQAERAQSCDRAADQRQAPNSLPWRAHQFVFGLVEGEGEARLVFIPAETARELAAVHQALRAETWGEFRSRMPAQHLAALQRVMEAQYLWGSFDEYYGERRASGTRAEREELWEKWCASKSRPPLDEDGFTIDAIPGCGEGGWPEWPEQEMLRWLPPEICSGFGEVLHSGLNGRFLALDAGRAPEIIEALERAGYECLCDEALVRRACGVC